MRQRRCLSVQDGQGQLVAVYGIACKDCVVFGLHEGIIPNPALTIFCKGNNNRRRQQVVALRCLCLGQAVGTGLQVGKSFIGCASTRIFQLQYTLSVGNAGFCFKACIHLAVLIQLFQRELNTFQQLLLVVLAIVLGRLLGNIQRKLRVLLRVGDGHGLLCIVVT